jgi:subtilisin family serine protease
MGANMSKGLNEVVVGKIDISKLFRGMAFLVVLLVGLMGGRSFAVMSDFTEKVQNEGGDKFSGSGYFIQPKAALLEAKNKDIKPRKQPASKEGKYRDGEIIVKFKQHVADADKNRVHARHGAQKIQEFKSIRGHHVKLKKGMTVEEGLKLYRSDPEVEYAEPNYMYKAQQAPDDRHYGLLWGMERINASAAWDITTGGQEVVVAVLDTGIDYNHEDLQGNLWINPSPGYDSNNDGTIDVANDVYGYNAITNTGNVLDDNGHGTHVSGTIGAKGNNGLGVAGVNWNVRVMALKFLDANGYGSLANAIECLEYVKSMKARGVNIVATNNSWGGGGESQALYDAIKGQQDDGILFIAAAGNELSNNDILPTYPASYQLANIISVGAITSYYSTDVRAWFSNIGRQTVHVMAPGDSILSLRAAGAFTEPWLSPSNFPENDTSSKYIKLRGTSMATPHVSGLAALLKASDVNRDWRAIRNLILAGGDDMPKPAADEIISYDWMSEWMIRTTDSLTVTNKRINANGSVTCTNKPVFSILEYPTEPVVGGNNIVSALSINCANSVGPVTVSLSSGETLSLHDDGVLPDQAAGDGIFSSYWVPTTSAGVSLTFNSPVASETVAPMKFSPQLVVDPPARIENEYYWNIPPAPKHGIITDFGTQYRQQFPIIGGIAPFTFRVVNGELPAGLTLNAATGEITGTVNADGGFYALIEVTDAVGDRDYKSFDLFVANRELRSGWPQVLDHSVNSYLSQETASPVFADLDGDGKDEIIVAQENTLYVYYADGHNLKYTLPGNASTPAVGDINGDGLKEIVVTTKRTEAEGSAIYAFRADSTTLTKLPNFPVILAFSPANTPVLEDLNNDGILEIIAVMSQKYNNNYLYVINGNGATLPGWPRQFGADNLSIDGKLDISPAVADLDYDGNKEIVTVSEDGIAHIYRHDGTEKFQWQFASAVTKVFSPVLADINGDGYLDIVLKYISNGMYYVTVFDQNGQTLPGWPRALSHDGGDPYEGLIVGDINNDGQPEIIAVSGGVAWSYLYLFSADGAMLTSYPMTPYYQQIRGNLLLGDLNGDGKQDIVMNGAREFWERNSWTINAAMALTYDGIFIDGFPKYSLGGNIGAPALGDFDGNGRYDLAVKNEDGKLYVYELQQSLTTSPSVAPAYGYNPQHTGVLPVPPLAVSLKKIDFGSIVVNTSGTQEVTLTYPGIGSLEVTGMIISGTDSAQYSVLPGTCGPFPFTLAQGNHCTMEVVFTPSTTGVKSALLAISTNKSSTANTNTIPLLGKGVNPTRSITYNKTGAGNGTVYFYNGTEFDTYFSDPIATCQDSCTQSFDVGSTITAYTYPQYGSNFLGWSGCDSVDSTGQYCTVTITADKSVSAQFDIQTFNVTASVTTGSGTVTPTSSTVNYGSSQTITITPSAGYYIHSLTDNGSPVTPVQGPAGTYTYTINQLNANHVISVVFYGIDLYMTQFSGPPTAKTGQIIALTDTIASAPLGGTAVNFQVGFSLSTNNACTTGLLPIGNREIGSLASGASNSGSTQLTIPTNLASGIYYVCAIVDVGGVVVEANENNNIVVGGPLVISASDLTMTAVSGPTSGVTGGSYTVTNTVTADANGGATGAFWVRIYLHPSSGSDIFIGERYLGSGLPSGQSNSANTAVTIPTNVAAGGYVIRAIADALGYVAESNEGNNITDGNAITIAGADLTMTAVSGPTSGVTGGSYTVTNTVTADANGGATGAFWVRIYLHPSSGSDIFIGERYLGSGLPSGQSNSANTAVTIPTNVAAGGYVIRAIADALGYVAEAIESNNSMDGNTISIN